MRFLSYERPAQRLPAHVDASKWDIQNASRGRTGRRSTHTFILFLTGCARGGGTALLDAGDVGAGAPVAVVQPRRGRLLVFPHGCLHAGEATVCVPKVLLRGELF